MPRGFNLTQVQLELGHLAFARVTNVVLPAGGPHFYGFAADVTTGETIWFKRAQYSDRPIFVGPARVDVPPRPGDTESAPKRNDVIVGRVARSSRKGPAMRWWSAGARPLLTFRRIIQSSRPTRLHTAHYCRELQTPDQTDGLWLLARVLHGDLRPVAEALFTARNRQPHHPLRRNGQHQRARGLAISGDPYTFCFYAAMFARCPGLLERVHDLWRTHRGRVLDRSAADAKARLTPDLLATLLGEKKKRVASAAAGEGGEGDGEGDGEGHEGGDEEGGD